MKHATSPIWIMTAVGMLALFAAMGRSSAAEPWEEVLKKGGENTLTTGEGNAEARKYLEFFFVSTRAAVEKKKISFARDGADAFGKMLGEGSVRAGKELKRLPQDPQLVKDFAKTLDILASLAESKEGVPSVTAKNVEELGKGFKTQKWHFCPWPFCI